LDKSEQETNSIDKKHRGIHWSKEEIEVATKSYRDGLSIKEIANKYNCNRNTIARIKSNKTYKNT